MSGKWQKEVPAVSGQYHTANYLGEYAGIRTVAYDKHGNLVYADGVPGGMWGGYWHTTPIVAPKFDVDLSPLGFKHHVGVDPFTGLPNGQEWWSVRTPDELLLAFK